MILCVKLAVVWFGIPFYVNCKLVCSRVIPGSRYAEAIGLPCQKRIGQQEMITFAGVVIFCYNRCPVAFVSSALPVV